MKQGFGAAALLLAASLVTGTATAAEPPRELSVSSTAGTTSLDDRFDRDARGTGSSSRLLARHRVLFWVSPLFPQLGQPVKTWGWSRPARRREVILQSRRAGSDRWRTVAHGRGNSNGNFKLVTGPWQRSGVHEFRARIDGGYRSPIRTLRFQPALDDSWKLVSDQDGGLRFSHNAWGPLVASDDLKTVVYGLADDVYADPADSWWIRRQGEKAVPLQLLESIPVRYTCDLSGDGRYLLYRTAAGSAEYKNVDDEMVLLDLLSGERVTVAVPETGVQDWDCGAVSNDGQRVAYSLEFAGAVRTERVAVWDRSTDVSSVATVPLPDVHVWGARIGAISADGQHVVWVASACTLNGAGDDCVSGLGDAAIRWDTDSGDQQVISQRYEYNMEVSADAATDTIAYYYWTTEKRNKIVVVDVPTGQARVLASSSGRRDDYIELGDLSADGTALVYQYIQDNQGGEEAVLVDVGSGRQTTIATYSGHAWVEPWQVGPGGETALFAGIKPMTRGERDRDSSDVYIWHRHP